MGLIGGLHRTLGCSQVSHDRDIFNFLGPNAQIGSPAFGRQQLRLGLQLADPGFQLREVNCPVLGKVVILQPPTLPKGKALTGIYDIPRANRFDFAASILEIPDGDIVGSDFTVDTISVHWESLEEELILACEVGYPVLIDVNGKLGL